MPRIDEQSLRQIGFQIFEAAGCSPQDARTVADHLVESSLFGHDSHGAIRLYEYPQMIEKGVWNPKGVPHVVDEKPCTAIIDGGGAMGQVGATFATEMAIRKAREHGVATVTLRNTSHVGRVGAYPLMVAREGMIGLMFVNGGRFGCQIPPFGGLDGRLCTNPIAFAAPRRQAHPIMVDMATSVVAEGKIRVARNRGERVPEGWLADHDGRPSTDPADYLERGGVILPIGGVVGYKGYCLSFIVELLGGALGGEGVAAGKTPLKSNGVLLTVFRIEHFTEIDTFYDEVEQLIRYVHSSRIDPKIGEILLPGEPEFRCAEKRMRNGIDIDEVTWSQICTGAQSLGLDPRPWQQMLIAT